MPATPVSVIVTSRQPEVLLPTGSMNALRVVPSVPRNASSTSIDEVPGSSSYSQSRAVCATPGTVGTSQYFVRAPACPARVASTRAARDPECTAPSPSRTIWPAAVVAHPPPSASNVPSMTPASRSAGCASPTCFEATNAAAATAASTHARTTVKLRTRGRRLSRLG